MENLLNLWASSGLAQISPGQVVMIVVGFGLLYLAIVENFEPLLLVPIGFGGVLANIPGAGLALSAVENAIASGDIDVLTHMSQALAVPVHAGTEQLLQAFSGAEASVHVLVAQIGEINGVT